MRIAALADIQGNLQALEAVLEDMKNWSPDLVLVGGDICFRCAESLEVLELLSTIDHIAIRGNGDVRVLRAPEEVGENEHPVIKLARYTKDRIGSKWVKYLSELPDHRFIDARGNKDICLSHGIPGDPFKGVIWSEEREQQLLSESDRWPNAFVRPEDLKEVLRSIPSDLYVTGHIHRQFQRYIEGVTVVNPGAFSGDYIIHDGQAMAEYMIIELVPTLNVWAFVFRQVPYDVRTTIARLESIEKDCDGARWSINLIKGMQKHKSKTIQTCRFITNWQTTNA